MRSAREESNHAAQDPREDSSGDDAAMVSLRLAALALSDGTDWSRCDDHQVLDHLWTAAPRPQHSKPALLRLVTVAAATPSAPMPPPPAAASPRALAASPRPPAAADSTFGSELDVQAMVGVLVLAAQDGTPFCEECARPAAAGATT